MRYACARSIFILGFLVACFPFPKEAFATGKPLSQGMLPGFAVTPDGVTPDHHFYSIKFTFREKPYRAYLQFLVSEPTKEHPQAQFKLKIKFPDQASAFSFFNELLRHMGFEVRTSDRSDLHTKRMFAIQFTPPFTETPVGINASISSARNSHNPIPYAVQLDRNGAPLNPQPTQSDPQFLIIYVDNSEDAEPLLTKLRTIFHLMHVSENSCPVTLRDLKIVTP